MRSGTVEEQGDDIRMILTSLIIFWRKIYKFDRDEELKSDMNLVQTNLE